MGNIDNSWQLLQDGAKLFEENPNYALPVALTQNRPVPPVGFTGDYLQSKSLTIKEVKLLNYGLEGVSAEVFLVSTELFHCAMR